ncbi:hypothetical protein BDU57DRAFT_79478 [Ampelomyces quisqualis]|uniref:Uncharacterized protein n=1 Tax=Ampelomyces quisqualis TaxID=50730 RepID=A0A6A5Q9M3_AMPQU|nr:hypothetical protein BDU57DRAFT_79478 [Ampelomyces quisqualis]
MIVAVPNERNWSRKENTVQRSAARCFLFWHRLSARLGLLVFGEGSKHCHEAISRNNPTVCWSCRLTVLTCSCIMVLAFHTQTLLYMHIGEMAVNCPMSHCCRRWHSPAGIYHSKTSV